MHSPLIPDSTGYAKIVVPLDGSSLSETALPVATSIARASQGTVYLVRVHTPIIAGVDVGFPMPDWEDEIRDSEQAHIAEVARTLLAGGGIHVEARLLDGPVGKAIKDAVTQIGAALVVITTHGRTGLSRAWLGSTADWLVRFTPVPVLLVRPPEKSQGRELGLRHILIALDGSERAERAIPEAIRLGAAAKARFTLVRIVQPVVRSVVTYGTATLPLVHDEPRTSEIMHRAKDYLEEIAEQLRRAPGGLEVHTEVIASERTGEAILARAHSGGAEVIALSTRGRGASRLLVGSVADKVLRGFTGAVLALGPAAVRELETDEIVEEPEVITVS